MTKEPGEEVASRTRAGYGIRLGISRVVGKPGNRRGRVVYDEDGAWMIPEQVVLSRWRKRTGAAGETFHGFRLPPGTWRTVAACMRALDWPSASRGAAAEVLAGIRAEHPTLRSPGAENLLILVRYVIAHGVLETIVRRHAKADPKSPGIPDLFLYRRQSGGRIAGGKFVEVKRPREALSQSQAAELAFLRSIGLGAGVVRLIEPAGR